MPAVLVVVVTAASVWVARQSDLEAFCATAVAIHNPGSRSGFPEYGPLVYLARETLSPQDARRIEAAVKEAQDTRKTSPSFYYDTSAVGEQLMRLCPDHTVLSAIVLS